MSVIDYSEFVKLSDPFLNRAFRLRLLDDPEWLDFPTAGKLSRGELPAELVEPVRFETYEGRQLMDFLWTALSPLRCVSQRVVSLLEENGLTGWSLYPVEAYSKGERLPNYHGFAVTGRGGTFQRDLSSKANVTRPSGKIAEVYKGFYFDPDEWDGTDLFLVSSRIIATTRLQQAFIEAKVSNVKFTPLTEIEVPLSLLKFQ